MLKRENFTNEEIVKILNLCKIQGEDEEYRKQYNSVLDDAIEVFANDFSCDQEEYHALAYKPEENSIVHIGTILPQIPIKK